MENDGVMDRLICGDVGFGKRKWQLVQRSKRQPMETSRGFVPTTILAFQHYRSFKERLKDFPVNILYLNRFRSAKQKMKPKKDSKW